MRNVLYALGLTLMWMAWGVVEVLSMICWVVGIAILAILFVQFVLDGGGSVELHFGGDDGQRQETTQ